MTKFFETINDYNLCTYYVMPLLKLSKFSFGPGNFEQCFLTPDGKFLTIRLRFDVSFLQENESYIDSYHREGKDYVVLSVPEEWQEDVQKFITGKYSTFSSKAKEMIRSFSGLMYRQAHPATGKTSTDARLLALDEDVNQRNLLRSKLEEELGCLIPEDLELISLPQPENYIVQ